MDEWIHRCILFIVAALVVLSAAYGVIGTNVYLDSGRSIMKDLSTSTGYIWKKGSCDDLFRGLFVPGEGGPYADQARDLCNMARENHLPPISLKTVVDARRTPGNKESSVMDRGQAGVVLKESRAEFVLGLPALKAYYEPYQKRVSYMWHFAFALAGAIIAYFYARSYAPVLFAAVKRHFEHLLFGKNRYDDAWQSFIKPKKKP